MYPDYNIERIDSDVLTRKGEHIRLLEKFQNGDIDILVGTQMIAKGLDNPERNSGGCDFCGCKF